MNREKSNRIGHLEFATGGMSFLDKKKMKEQFFFSG